ncbi:MAG TPA: serine protease, partial [Gammaproteobacteria bacterium]|nr:serine protease [Gammaproteobacteria bacterium]
MQQADPDVVRAERTRVAARHREQFLPAAEKFARLQSAAVASRIIDAAAETTPPGDLAVIEGGVIPEILQRDNDLRPVRYLQIALLAARSVGRIRVVGAAGDDEGDGTGFLVAPGLLLTNWHVLKTRELAEACSVIFDDEDGLDGDPKELKVYRFLPQRLYVSDKDLDYAIVEVSPRTSS